MSKYVSEVRVYTSGGSRDVCEPTGRNHDIRRREIVSTQRAGSARFAFVMDFPFRNFRIQRRACLAAISAALHPEQILASRSDHRVLCYKLGENGRLIRVTLPIVHVHVGRPAKKEKVKGCTSAEKDYLEHF